MNKLKVVILSALFVLSIVGAWGQAKAPLELLQSTPLPDLHDGDFDHFAVDVAGGRLFATAEEKHLFSGAVVNLFRVDFSRPWQRSQSDGHQDE